MLDRLHLHRPLSRSDLAERTGLNRSTIADLIAELKELGLVVEEPGLTNSGPGRPSSLVNTRPEGAVVLAIELPVDSVAVATIGLGGHVYNKVRVARPRGRFSPEETVDDISKLAKPILASLPTDHLLAGVGVAVAGVVRRSDGFVHIAPNLGWRNVPLGSMVAEEFPMTSRVRMANEADLGALVESLRGSGIGASHMLYVAGEAGIGAGIIQDGQPMLGAAGYAGEVGHTLINPAGRKCRCGGVGCWETEAGEAALARHAGMPGTTVGQKLIDEVVRAVNTGDQRALTALEEVGRWLGMGIGNLINTFNPQRVVIGGFYDELFPYLEKALVAASRDVALEAPGETATIVRGTHGVDAPLRGAAELVFSEVTADPAALASEARGGGQARSETRGPGEAVPVVS